MSNEYWLKKYFHIDLCLKSSHELSSVHKDLSSLSIDYIVLEQNYCYSSSGKCRFSDIWKVEDIRLGRTDYSKDTPLICHQLFTDPKPLFKRVFANNYYHVLQLIKWTTLKTQSLTFRRTNSLSNNHIWVNSMWFYVCNIVLLPIKNLTIVCLIVWNFW